MFSLVSATHTSLTGTAATRYPRVPKLIAAARTPHLTGFQSLPSGGASRTNTRPPPISRRVEVSPDAEADRLDRREAAANLIDVPSSPAQTNVVLIENFARTRTGEGQFLIGPPTVCLRWGFGVVGPTLKWSG